MYSPSNASSTLYDVVPTLLASSPQLANLVNFENLYISVSALGETVPHPGNGQPANVEAGVGFKKTGLEALYQELVDGLVLGDRHDQSDGR